VKLKEGNIDAEIDRLADEFKEMVSGEPQSYSERFTKILLFQEPDRMPIFPTIHEFSAKFAGITIRELCTDAKKMIYSQLYTAVRFKFDVVVKLSDIYNYEPEALGAKMHFPEDSWPVILEPLIKEPGDLEKLDIPDFNKAGRSQYVHECNKLYLEKLGEYGFHTAIANAPWSMAVQIRGFNNLVKDTRRNPEFVHRLLDFCVDVIEAFVKTQQETLGTPLFPILSDAFSCIPPTSPKIVYDYVFPHTAELIKRLGMVLWIGGYPVYELPGWEQIVEATVTKTGAPMGIVMMLESDWMPPEKIKEISNRLHKPWLFGTRAALISEGTPEEIENYVKNTIKVLAPGGGCILIGDQVPVDTPPENLETFISAMKKYGKYPVTE